jgi:phosphohistidine phosphatase
MNKIIILLRHTKAKSAEYPQTDFERKLSAEGKACASFMGEKLTTTLQNTHLQNQQINKGEQPTLLSKLAAIGPEKIICSNAKRTQETLQNLQQRYNTSSSDIEYTDKTYEATTGSLLNQLQQLPAKTNTVMMIGHNPGTEFLAQILLTDKSGYMPQDIHFSTGTIAIIGFRNLQNWAALGSEENTGELVQYLTPKTLGWRWES